MRILGIDPGLATIGFAILDVQGRQKQVASYGVISTDKTLTLSERLDEIYKDMGELLDEFKPDHCAIEQIFFSKNVTTGISVSHARGVILLALQQANIPFKEYSPSALKLALTGDGSADKQAIQKMVKLELKLQQIPRPDDAADALSLALTLSSELR